MSSPPSTPSTPSAGSTALSRMIQQQADVLDEIAGRDLSAQAAVLADARRVLVIGTGTSQHAAELGSMMLEQAGVDARAVPAVQWARWGTGPRPGDAMVVITHTAETAYAVRARAAAQQAGVPLVTITGRERGWPEAIQTVAAEQSETYTVSYTAALGVLSLLAHRLGWTGGGPAELTRAARQVRAVCADPEADRVPMPARSLAIVGCGPWGVTAREGALKIREAARMLAEGFDSDRFLHGSAVPYSASDGLVLLEPEADADGLTGALGAAARQEGIPTSVLRAAGPGEDPLHPLLAQLPMTARLQLLAERYARLRGQDPDVAIVGAWGESALWEIGAPAEPAG